MSDAARAGQLEGLTANRRPHLLPKKQRVYAEGDEATRLYFVQAGRVKTARCTEGGKELITGPLVRPGTPPARLLRAHGLW